MDRLSESSPEFRQQVVMLLRALHRLMRRMGKRKAGGTRSQRRKTMQAAENRRKYVRRTEKNRKIVLDARTRPCMDCGLFYGAECMEFDHRDGEIKSFCVGDGKYGPKKRLLAEIAKTDVVCCACHEAREIARGRDHGRTGPSQCPNIAKRGVVKARPLVRCASVSSHGQHLEP